MERSEEIRRVVDRWLVAMRDWDADTVIEKISDHPGVLGIGSDADEWWHRTEAAVWRQQLDEAGGFPFTWDEIESWEEGTVGWSAAKVTLTTPAAAVELRSTFVLHLERGEWKIVQFHLSAGMSNVEVFGRALTVSLDQLEQTLRRERPDLTGTLAADGTVTIVFTDIVDSTVMISRLGDQGWVEALHVHDRVIRDAVAAHGGTLVETQGDGSMLAFSSARRAVSCACAIQSEIERAFADASPPVRVRIGIHTGDALRESDRFYGTTVHYAARVASSALGGEVLVSNLVHQLVAASGIPFRESREVELKGLEGLHQLFAVDLPPHS